MNYEHDLFVSYRRSDEDWVRWTRDNFLRALRSLLRPRLGPISVYFDENIETGASWPNHLAQHLARSKMLIAVLSRDYFQSDWCRLELSLMHHRERLAQFRTATNPSGLIIPVAIDDGETFPEEVRAMQCEAIHQFANPFIRVDSPKQEALAEFLRERLCPAIESALRRVPAFDPSWEELAHQQFEHMFRVRVRAQTSLPMLVLAGVP